jgi:hypothetical protein
MAIQSDANEIMRLHRSGLTQAEIGHQVGMSQTGIGAALRRNGVSGRRAPERRYTLDEAYFSDVTTREQAYWLGFLAADGFLIRISGSPRPTGLGVRLAESDSAHLQLLADCLRSDAPVRHRAPAAAEVRFYSVRLVSDLERHGIVHAKTFTCTPWEAPGHLAADYWRGAIDGDGYVSARGEVVFCGTRAMCEGFADFARDACGTTVRPVPSGNVSKLPVSGRRQVNALITALYGHEGIALARKRDRALSMIAAYEPPPGRPPCRVPGCDRTSIARQLCSKHYQQWTKYGEALKPPFAPLTCTAPGCLNPQVAKGYCSGHYARWRRHGDALAGRPYYRLSEVQ